MVKIKNSNFGNVRFGLPIIASSRFGNLRSGLPKIEKSRYGKDEKLKIFQTKIWSAKY